MEGLQNAIYRVKVDDEGWINVDLRGVTRLTQYDTQQLAIELLVAIRLSQDRNQLGEPSYYDTVNIQRRAESKLGQAIAAARRVFA